MSRNDEDEELYECPYCGEDLGDSMPDKCPTCKMPIHSIDVVRTRPDGSTYVRGDESFKSKASKFLCMSNIKR